MSVPFFDFSVWVELPYAYSRNLAATIEESMKILKLAGKLQAAHIPISDKHDPCPEFGVWGFAPIYPSLPNSDGLDHMIYRFEVLREILAKPIDWLSWGSQSPSNEDTLRDCVSAGLYLCKQYQGRIEITVGNCSGYRHEIQLNTEQRHLTATLDKLTPSRTPEIQSVKAKILSVDFTRGIIYTSIGAVQFNDPDIATAAFDAIGREVNMGLDFDAPPLRTEIPEILSLDSKD